MTSRILLTAAGALCALSAAPTLASPCGDRIVALHRRLDEGTARAAAASSGGQAVAAAREGQASQPGSRNEPTVPFQDPAREAQATRQAAEAGGGGTGNGPGQGGPEPSADARPAGKRLGLHGGGSGGRAPVGAAALSAQRILGGCSGSHSGLNEPSCDTRLMEPITG